MEESEKPSYKYMGSYVSTMPRVAPFTHLRLPPPSAHFLLPPLLSSFPSLLHPHFPLVKQQCDAWISDVAQPSSPAARRLLLECAIPRFVCRALPTAPSLPRLVHVTKLVAWFIIADDEDDHPDALGADDASSAEQASFIMAILRSKNGQVRNECMLDFKDGGFNRVLLDANNKSKNKVRALEALAKLWGEMQKEMTPGIRDRFIRTMADYFDAIRMQATFRKEHHLPNMEAYMEIRRQASFILPSFVLLEYALGMELDEEAYNNPLVEKFRNGALDYICLCNDLISCKTEIKVGDYFNMPSIVYSSSANKTWEFQDAINWVASMIKDIDMQCVSMLSTISSSPSLKNTHVLTYIVALCSSMSGSLSWYLETPRYHNSFSSSLED